MSVFDDVRTIAFPDILAHYGIEEDRNHNCLCPFHGDKHPSMKVYQDHGYCFACGVSTDGVKLVAHLFGLSPFEAAQRIAHDFGITDRHVAQEIVRKQQILRQNAEKRKQGVDRAHGLMIRYLWCLQHWLDEYRPVDPTAPLDERFVWALQNIEYVRYLLDEFFERSDSRRQEICESVVRELIKDGYILKIKTVLGGINNENDNQN